MNTKKLTILHSNDIHGDFTPTIVDGKETGGVSFLSGYIQKARSEGNTLYTVAGDMFLGSVIDSEYKGLSTIELFNLISPDVATIGNHEVDYGVAHLLFLEKCAKFPIINANMYITTNNARLFTPYINVEIDGLKILFIGILTHEVLATTKQESIIGTFLDIKEAAKEISVICDNYRTTSTDLTVVLSHIGYELDIELAKILDEYAGVDIIIGGHSHTYIHEKTVVNDILITQAGTGTDQIGRIDIEFDENRNITSMDYALVPINEDTAPRDEILDNLIASYQSETDKKYKRIVTRLARKLTHPSREQETEQGNLYADVLQWESSFDIMMMGSGSIRKTEIGPVIEYQDLVTNTPYDDQLWMIEVTGAQFRRMIKHVLRPAAWTGDTEFYQYSKGVRIVWSKSKGDFEEFKFNGEDITDDMRLRIGIQEFHYKNFDEFLGVPLAEVSQNRRPRVVASSINNIIEEYFSTNTNLDAKVEGRLVVLD
ncbi:MAG: bifunctional metallophosphatase/5'-nucleotidase [Eubacteriaceae bacterium]|nr:bifunctional metallophosphatase/5'-nucleotidase [Eubacteriaceae bacterium]